MNCTKEAGKMKKLIMKKLIISVVLLLITLTANAQISGKSIPELRREATAAYSSPFIPAFQNSIFPLHQSSNFKLNIFYSKPSVPIVYSYNNLAFFCKVEVKLEKAVNFPIKFRLGDVDYVDRLEGKRE